MNNNGLRSRLKNALATYSEYDRRRPADELDSVKQQVLAEFPGDEDVINDIFGRIKELHDLHLKTLQHPGQYQDEFNELGYDTDASLGHIHDLTPDELNQDPDLKDTDDYARSLGWTVDKPMTRESEEPRKIGEFTQMLNGKRVKSVRYAKSGDVYELAGGKWFKKDGNEWKPCEPLTVKESELKEEVAKICPHCGCVNAPDHMKCDDCGADIPEEGGESSKYNDPPELSSETSASQ